MLLLSVNLRKFNYASMVETSNTVAFSELPSWNKNGYQFKLLYSTVEVLYCIFFKTVLILFETDILYTLLWKRISLWYYNR